MSVGDRFGWYDFPGVVLQGAKTQVPKGLLSLIDEGAISNIFDMSAEAKAYVNSYNKDNGTTCNFVEVVKTHGTTSYVHTVSYI